MSCIMGMTCQLGSALKVSIELPDTSSFVSEGRQNNLDS